MNKNLKLYYASEKTPDVMFASEYCSEALAKEFLQEEKRIHYYPLETFHEVTCLSQIPEHWRDSLIWGIDEEMTPAQFLQRHTDPDYQLYLQLKERFEK